ncbi:AAA family ATPase [Parazoarcus communis]|uniref:AAA family ATPase n=1 Tax=Parazoarcus communis TaxID=41977 RepID=A0A2U8GYG3_9RHOO|nr:AAA family ATPase [Parazoarcus communis]AWI78508.1 AAA family ATPase [Parazoarcus communis]
MIETISLSKTATYGDQPEILGPLRRVNFIFGTNGTGKTTISRVIADDTGYAACGVAWKNGQPLQALVYNRDFVEHNFSRSAELKGVFTLGEKQVKAQEEMKEKKREADRYKDKIAADKMVLEGDDGKSGKRGDLAALEDRFLDQCWEAYGKHKEKLSHAFDGVRNSKKEFKARALREAASNTSQTVPLDELHKRAETIFGQALSEASVVSDVSLSILLGYESDPIIKKRVIGKEDVDIAEMIKKLGNSDWVREGRTFYDVNDRVCPFCQQATDEAFEKSLNEYFNESFERDSKAIGALLDNYKTEATRVLQELGQISASPSKFLDVAKFQSERDFLEAKLSLNTQQLVRKSKEPSQIFELESVGNIAASIAGLIAEANKKVADHNALVKNIGKEKAKLVSDVWKYMINRDLSAAYAHYKDTKGGLEGAIKSLEERVQNFGQEVRAREVAIRELEKQTTSVKPTIDAINSLLASFGFHGFSLAIADNGTSYQLVREDKSDAKETLSEGEKTFVTFLYFYHLLKGSDTESGITTDRVVVFDDPVSSLDSEILFIVGSLIKNVFDEARSGTSLIKQVFVLTHNVYFHKEVSFNNSRTDKALKDETFWVVRKPAKQSKLEKHDGNPIQTSYELLWSEVKNPNPSLLTIQNIMRRILENYFKFFGGIEPRDICARLPGKEQSICNSLLSWVNDGSHYAQDDIYVSMDHGAVQTYLKVFHLIFKLSEHEAHYKMMMGNDYVELEDFAHVGTGATAAEEASAA